MPRPKKKGLDYFPLDVDFFSDQKIKILKARYGADGITCYLYLLCEIYKNGYYISADEDFFWVMAEDLKMSIDKVKQVVTFLLDRSLLDSKLFQSDAVLSSAGIQKRFQLAVKERAKKTPVEVSDLWLLNEEETEPFIKVTHREGFSQKNGSNSRKNKGFSQEKSLKKSKVNKSKGNINNNKSADAEPASKKKVLQHYPEDPELDAVFKDFMEMRKKIRRPMTDRAITLLKNKLHTLATVDGSFNRDRAIAILNQSVLNSWMSVYPLKENNATVKPKQNSFHNFDQREVDYDDLERRLTRRAGNEQSVFPVP